MTQRDATTTKGGSIKTGVYEAPTRTAVVGEPTDLIRWGPIMGGLFAALATLITLGILGLAFGLSSFNANAPLGNFGIGAGIWGAITALVSFLIGGWVAGRSAAFSGGTSGVMNGAMVWFVAIPLLVYLLGSGVGALASTAGNVAGTVAQTAGAAAGAAAANPAVQATAGAAANDPALQATATGALDAAQATAQAIQESITPQDVNNAADTAGRTAWGILLSLGLAAAASILGGFLGARQNDPAGMRRA